MEHEAHTRLIIGCALAVHRDLPPGYLESVYKNALAVEARSRGLHVEREAALVVTYRGVAVGTFFADLVVERQVIVEVKAVRTVVPAHEAQLVHYLMTTGMDVGLLLNFGSPRLEIRRKWRTYSAGHERGCD